MGAQILARGAQRGCPVCGAFEVAHDEVLDTGVMLLSTCRRCDHRWTGRPLRPVATRHTDVEITSVA